MYELESIARNRSNHTPCIFIRPNHCKLFLDFVCTRMPAFDGAYDGNNES